MDQWNELHALLNEIALDNGIDTMRWKIVFFVCLFDPPLRRSPHARRPATAPSRSQQRSVVFFPPNLPVSGDFLEHSMVV
ncbi:hypothetical protein GUJ93_ZPchr0002g23733 [Zizania palustris]|uniref:Uncharacterized protein n=1 Tax=Zizania palustris TaxID=103762 RepID=A0A8J5VVJ7_ZIZPA|nr:hypothetical protein GUJ93_ZPchr0002g23733 [Zizania palustris]